MLDQYDGVLLCEVNYVFPEELTVEAKVVDVEQPAGPGIYPEFWLQQDIQIHQEFMPGITEEEFHARYKEGTRFRVHLCIQVLDQKGAAIKPAKKAEAACDALAQSN
jgi:hypothetical protein